MNKNSLQDALSTKNLSINYASADISEQYLRIADEVEIDDYLDYRSIRDNQHGLLHVILCVKVDNIESRLIPFSSIYTHKGLLDKNGRSEIFSLGQRNIEHDFSKFISVFFHDYEFGRQETTRFSFSVDYRTKNIYDLLFSPIIEEDQNIAIKTLKKCNDGSEVDALEELKKKLIDSEEKSFVQVFSKYYSENAEFSINKLTYNFFCFDSDFDSDEYLTRIMIISSDPVEVSNFIKMYLNKIRELVSFIRTRYVYDLLQRNRHEATKSAISAIMSRNMSHNLGSHYMYYTKAYLESVATNVDNNISPDIRGAAKVLGYVQARMDYLATVISNDKYPYGAVNFKSQLYDELTIDDFSHRHFLDEANKRTTNFLLTNLIYSENFSRPDVRCDEEIKFNGDKLFLYVKYSENGKVYRNFTGTWHDEYYDWVLEENDKAEYEGRTPLPTVRTEQDTKNRLSSLNIALPGGSMSCHAFFNVVENFIRNSAKYLSGDINKEEGLVCTVAIQPNEDKKYVDFVIYDNKQNANKVTDTEKKATLYQEILEKLATLVIIDGQNKIAKDNKGFKEMLFSAIWMRAYTFGKKTYADIVSEINQTESGDNKLDKIEEHGFVLVKVKEETDGSISIFKRQDTFQDTCNLGILITLPVFKQTDTLTLTNDRMRNINNMLNTMSDIVEVDENYEKSEFRHVFTHTIDVNKNYATVLEKYRTAIQKRFPDINEYAISFGTKQTAESTFEKIDNRHRIYFRRHLNTQEDASKFDSYAYADSISGGNFTITLLELFKEGYKNDHYLSDNDEILALKIKESALTRVTLIDERLYNSTKESDYPWLAHRNVRVLNYSDETASDIDGSFASVFKGSDFKDRRNETHFLSIHLGLIEKILKNSLLVNSLINQRLHQEGGNEDKTLASNRVDALMDMLKDYFGGENKASLFIAIHSGRGNYSAELEGPLCTYPFITLSALENAYNNSKYQLTQLLYNTVYIGKGLANKPHEQSSYECTRNHNEGLLYYSK